jgi:hypothetical protein
MKFVIYAITGANLTIFWVIPGKVEAVVTDRSVPIHPFRFVVIPSYSRYLFSFYILALILRTYEKSNKFCLLRQIEFD